MMQRTRSAQSDRGAPVQEVESATPLTSAETVDRLRKARTTPGWTLSQVSVASTASRPPSVAIEPGARAVQLDELQCLAECYGTGAIESLSGGS